MNLKYLLSVALLACPTALLTAEEKPPPKRERAIDFNGTQTRSTVGIVLAATKDSIMIVDTEDKEKCVTTYPAHDRLAAGTVHKCVTPGFSYLLTDVRAGDIVLVETFIEAKITYCVAICIHERPGGTIPPGQLVRKTKPYHEVRNAKIALRDMGTAIPEHLK